jgi:hypothetical protein
LLHAVWIFVDHVVSSQLPDPPVSNVLQVSQLLVSDQTKHLVEMLEKAVTLDRPPATCAEFMYRIR